MADEAIDFDDAEHVRQSLAGDRASFDTLVNRHVGMVHAVALARLNQNADQAEELTQEVFLRAWLQLEKLSRPEYFPAWVAQITRNLATDWIRRERRKSTLVQMVSEYSRENSSSSNDTPTFLEKYMQNEDEELIRAALNKLPADQRELLLMHFSEDLSHSDIARRMHVHPSTINRKMERALRRLRRLYGGEPGVALRARATDHKLLNRRTLAIITAAWGLSVTQRKSLAAAATHSLPIAELVIDKHHFLTTTGGKIMAVIITILILGASLGWFSLRGKSATFSTSEYTNAKTSIFPALPYQIGPSRVAKNATHSKLAASMAFLMTITGCNPAPPTTTHSGQNNSSQKRNDPQVTHIRKISSRTNSTAPRIVPGNTHPRSSAGSVTTDSITIVDGKISYLDGSSPRSGEIQLVGAVIDDPRWIPINGDLQTLKDEKTYHLELANARDIIILVKCDDLATMTLSVTSTPEARTSTAPGRHTYTRDIVLFNPVTLKGMVKDEKGTAIAGASIAWNLPSVLSQIHGIIADSSTTSSVDGSFQMKSVPPGNGELYVIASGYMPAVFPLNLPLTQSLVVRLQKGGATVAGTVLRAETNKPIAGVELNLYITRTTSGHTNMGGIPDDPTFRLATKTGKHVFSDSDGHFTIGPLLAGLYNWGVSANDHGNPLSVYTHGEWESSIEVHDNESTTANVMIFGGYTLEGRAYEKNTSTPIAGLKLTQQYGRGGQVLSSTTDGAGNFHFQGLTSTLSSGLRLVLDDKRYVIAESDSHANATAIPLPSEGFKIHHDLPLQRSVAISGIVKTMDDVPIPGARVKDMHGTEDNHAVTKSDGSFTIYEKPFSQLNLETSMNGFGTVIGNQIKLTDDDVTSQDIILKPGATISGKIVDPDDHPIEGASIIGLVGSPDGILSTSVSNDATSLKDGSFLLKDMPEIVSLFGRKPGFADSQTENLHLEPGEIKGSIILKLTTGLTIGGVVRNDDGKAISDSRIFCFPHNGSHYYTSPVSTDSQGKFLLKSLQPGSYQVSASKGNISETVEIQAGEQQAVITLHDKKTEDITCTLLDDETGRPISKFTVTGLDVVTYDKTRPGVFILHNLSEHTGYGISIMAEGYVSIKRDFSIGDPTTFRLGKGGSAVGRIIDKDSGKPLQGMAVVANQSDANSQAPVYSDAKSDAEGKFHLNRLPSGNVLFKITPGPPYSMMSKTESVKSGAELDIGDIALQKAATIRVKVINIDDETPIPGKRVSAWHFNGSIESSYNQYKTTDESGIAEFTDAVPGIPVSISAGSVSKDVTAKAGTTEDVTLSIGTVKFHGRMTLAGDPLLSGFTLTDEKGSKFGGGSEMATGQYTMENLHPGKYSMSLSTQYIHYSTDFSIPDQSDFEKDFDIPGGYIAGAVTDAAGAPVAGATVEFASAAPSSLASIPSTSGSTKTDSDGHYKFDSAISPGTYTLTAAKETFGRGIRRGIQVGNGTAQADIQLSAGGGAVESIALDITDGKAVQRAWCLLSNDKGTLPQDLGSRDDSGLLRISNVPAGKYTATVSATGYSIGTHQIEVKDGETVQLSDVLSPSGSTTWKIQSPSGKPLIGAQVTISPQDSTSIESQRTGVTSENGSFSARGLSPGTYLATAQAQGKPAVTTTFIIKAKNDTPVSTTTTFDW